MAGYFPFKKHVCGGIHLFSACVIGLLFAANSLAGITASARIYPSIELYNSFLPNDYINLFFGIPILILSAALVSRKAVFCYACWAATLMFVIYNSIAYLFTVRNIFSLLVNAFIILLCITELILAIYSFSRSLVLSVSDVRSPRFYGGILTGIGLIFVARALINIIRFAGGLSELSLPEVGVNIADIVVCSFWIISGTLLIIKKRLGTLSAWISYLHGSILFLALLAFLIIQPMLCGTEFIFEDLIVIGVMSLLLIIPCILLTRRLSRKQQINP